MPLSVHPQVALGIFVDLVSVLSFLMDLAADVWAIVQYVLVGRYLWAALVFILLGQASVLLQLFSWLWLTSDPIELHQLQPSRRFLALLHLLQLGYLYR